MAGLWLTRLDKICEVCGINYAVRREDYAACVQAFFCVTCWEKTGHSVPPTVTVKRLPAGRRACAR